MYVIMMKITKNMKYMLVGLFIAVIIGIYFFTRRKNISTYKFPDTSSLGDLATVYNKYNQLLLSCADTYNISKDQAAYNTCLTSNVTFFTSNACPAVITNAQGARTVTTFEACGSLSSTDKVCGSLGMWYGSNVAYTADETAIKNAYVDMISRADTTAGSLTFPSAAVITAARKADVRAATNRYLSNLCPAFYRTTSSNTVTKVETGYDTTDYFRAYRTNDTTVNYYLDDSGRLNGSTDALRQTAATNLIAWAKNAGNQTSELVLATGPIVAMAGSRWDSATAGYNGSAVDNEDQPCFIPNWVMAHNFGPGTLIKQGTLLNGTGANKLPITWATASGTKTCYYTPPTSGVVHKD
jgi:hypothetical protein